MRKQPTSQGSATIVVVGVGADGMGRIRECLGTEAVLPAHSTPYHEAIETAREVRPRVVIMGFDHDFEWAVSLGPRLFSELPGIQLVAFSDRTDPERIRAAMRSGYREYVMLPEDAGLLRQAVHDAASSEFLPSDQGSVVAVVGTKGGCGTTLLSANLAAEISPVYRVCVVDMDFSMGDVAAFLDLQPQSSVQEVLLHLNRLDARMLAGSVAVHPSKVHVLAQPTDLTENIDVAGEDIVRILTATADSYQYVLVDCGAHVDTATLTTTAVADQVLLICTPDVPSVKNAWRRLQLFDRQGINREGIRLVVNRWDKNAQLTERDIETNLGIPVSAVVANDPAACNRAVNIGMLIRDVDKRSAAARDISSLVTLITEQVERVEPAENPGPLGWLFK